MDSLTAPLFALGQVLAIDVILAADNAVAVGLAAAGLGAAQRRVAILAGLAGAVVMRIVFALAAVVLLKLPGLLIAGGLLLFWIAWSMWRELKAGEADESHTVVAAKSLPRAVLQILAADVSMSLDNILAVAGAARNHPQVLAVGLLLSVALMGLAANAIAGLLTRHRWIAYVGLVVIVFVAGKMVVDGAVHLQLGL